jgi:HK97 family phage prohead protease
MTQQERRAGRIVELRTMPGVMPQIRGRAAVIDQPSEDLGFFREKVARGAFKESIRTDDIRALWNHDSRYVLGRNKAGTLALRETLDALEVVIDPPDVKWARDLVTSIQRGDVSGMSFSFNCIEDDWNTENGITVRTLKKVRLIDVSPATFPAYVTTDVSTRSLEAIFQEGRRRLGRAAIGRPGGIALMRMRLELEA